MSGKKKSLLLIPTTDHVVKSFEASYKGLSEVFDIFIILDNVNIKGNYSFDCMTILQFSSVKDFSSAGLVEKIILFILNSRYTRNKFLEYYRNFQFDAVIVSNDCPLVQNICLQEAKKLGVPVIAHQVASGIINQEKKKLSLSATIQSMLLKIFSGTTKCRGYGGNSDHIFLMGNAWQGIVPAHIDSSKVDIVPNGYYYYFKSIYEENIKLLDRAKLKKLLNISPEKKVVVFYSQPFYEIGLFTKDETCSIYEKVDELFAQLSSNFNCLFKPHPQEKLFKSFQFSGATVMADNMTPEESLLLSDVAISVSSSMSLQSRIIDKYSIGFWPSITPSNYKVDSQYFFDFTSSSISSIKNSLNEQVWVRNSSGDIHEAIYMKEAPEDVLLKKFSEILRQ